jgi:NAD(P)H-dependent FMN reductase
MTPSRPLFIPVILGTPRQGRRSEYVVQFLLGELSKRNQIDTTIIDIGTLSLPSTDARKALKDAQFSALIMWADALVLVVPESNTRRL